jgi:hypothetical protein
MNFGYFFCCEVYRDIFKLKSPLGLEYCAFFFFTFESHLVHNQIFFSLSSVECMFSLIYVCINSDFVFLN